MSSPRARHLHTARWIRPELLAGSPEWTVGLRRHLTAVWFAAGGLILCILLPGAGFPGLYVAAVAVGAFYHDCEPLEVLRLPEMNASRLLVRKDFLLTAPFALLAIVAHPRTAWMAVAWAPLAALALLYAVVAKYVRYVPENSARRPVAERLGIAGFLIPILLPLSLCLTVSYALRAERNLNRYLDDYD